MDKENHKRSFKEYVVLTLKGLAMGAADVVPGVSGGTIAFIAGIYDELLHSLSKLGPSALITWKQEGFLAAWKSVNGGFLLALFSGILISIKTFAHIITAALEHYPVLVWAFFSGLIAASIIYFGWKQKGWKIVEWLACIAGAVLVYGISIATPAQLPGDWWMLFIGGFIAICAMILPGISGSFLLLLMGLYPVFLRAISDLDVVALASFGLGCVSGLLCFSRVLAWLMDHYHKITFAVLIGFLVGSLNVTWPWKEVVLTTVDRHGDVIPLVQQNVLPAQFALVSGTDPMLFGAVLTFLFGVFVVLMTEFSGRMFGVRD